jgi:ferredoxin
MSAATHASTGDLAIDWTRCDGHGACAKLLPDLIALDDWGYPIIKSTAGAPLRSLRRAAAVCPALALRVTTN